MDYVATICVAIIGSGGITALINYWIETRREERKKRENDPMMVGVRLLLQDRIEGLCIKYINAGEITYEQLKFLRQAYACYKVMGGNGDLEDLMESIEKLHVVYPPKK